MDRKMVAANVGYHPPAAVWVYLEHFELNGFVNQDSDSSSCLNLAVFVYYVVFIEFDSECVLPECFGNGFLLAGSEPTFFWFLAEAILVVAVGIFDPEPAFDGPIEGSSTGCSISLYSSSKFGRSLVKMRHILSSFRLDASCPVYRISAQISMVSLRMKFHLEEFPWEHRLRIL
ncbi:hypothetical protein OUZ56_011884 [Daphnia magna]|uniref:Uncharacterized protein n=1 Tax=Daphnia magna TaxID=35525 RepID=A0ABQ9Z1E4_9CRUS|nr:hypothetical protein OUZ56_011884 [Daphnia magna]